MATYEELRSEFTHTELQHRVQVALMIAAHAILTSADTTAPPYSQVEGAHDLRVKWAASVVVNTAGQAANLLKLVLAANADFTLAQIRGATDEAIQAQVELVIDALAAAQFGA